MSDSGHLMNIGKSDIFEQIWSVLPFVPLVILYSHFIQYLDTLVELLQNNFEIIRQINTFAGFGISSIILLFVEKAAATSENDFISGPIQTFNTYAFFYIGFLLGGFQLAIIGLAFYLVVQKINIPFLGRTSIAQKEWVKFQSLGMSRPHFVFQHFVFEPFANLGGVALAFFFLANVIPMGAWVQGGFYREILFLSIIVAAWKAIEQIAFAIYFWQVPFRGAETIIVFLIVAVPPALFLWQINAWTIGFYFVAYIFAWISLGTFILTEINRNGNVAIGKNVRGTRV